MHFVAELCEAKRVSVIHEALQRHEYLLPRECISLLNFVAQIPFTATSSPLISFW
jgi:hypothetical protein